jgi:hypothetical protein
MLSDYEKTIRRAEIMVREAGYNYVMATQLRLRGVTITGVDPEEIISRAANLYECAKSVLQSLDPDNAEAFINSTYGAHTYG